MNESVTVRASPSLALLKYWGKQNRRKNLPATTSVAVTLDGLFTQTRVTKICGAHEVFLNGCVQSTGRITAYLDFLKKKLSLENYLRVETKNSFPTGAGIASSSSGFAALAWAAAQLGGNSIPMRKISALARYGSASAARAVYGGFTLLRRGAACAQPLYQAEFWPELRILVLLVEDKVKAVSSRQAMELSRLSSPLYSAWLKTASNLVSPFLRALGKRDINTMGQIMQRSYLAMFATMFTSAPPVFFWSPVSLELLKYCQSLREDGLAVWETMDAGPQVKLLCLSGDEEEVKKRITVNFPQVSIIASRPGPGPQVVA